MNRVEEAILFATKAHEGQIRKGSSIPYIWHPLAVGRLLSDQGCTEDVVAAGVLHDLLEDTAASRDQIEERFGDRVARIVEGCSEPDKSLPWEERKRHTLERLGGAPRDVRLVTAADKIDNLRSILVDQERLGDGVWCRFRRGPKKQEWYYRGIVKALGDGHPLFLTLEDTVDRVFAGL